MDKINRTKTDPEQDNHLHKGAILQPFDHGRVFKGLGIAKWYCRRDLIGDSFVQYYLGAWPNNDDRARHFLRLHGIVLLFASDKAETPPICGFRLRMICSGVNRFRVSACLLPKPKTLIFNLDSFQS